MTEWFLHFARILYAMFREIKPSQKFPDLQYIAMYIEDLTWVLMYIVLLNLLNKFED